MGPHGNRRAVQRLDFCHCRKGLGVKIIGGHRELNGEEFGIFIKRVVGGGLAALDGRLKSGDLILDVNNMSLIGVTNERAVEILRTASLSNRMTLLITRDDESKREFSQLMEKYSPNITTSAGPTSLSHPPTGKLADADGPQLLSPKEGPTSLAQTDPTHPASTPSFRNSVIQLICVAKATGLGLVLKGGTDHTDGPMVFIQELVPGGDGQKDGRLQVGDQLVSVNKESLVGVTLDEARSILNHTGVRSDPTVEIAFVRRGSSSGSCSGPQSPDTLKGSRCRQQPRPLEVCSVSLQPTPPVKAAPGRKLPAEPPAVTIRQVGVSPVRPELRQVSCPPGGDRAPAAGLGDRQTPWTNPPPDTSCRIQLDKLEQALALLALKPTAAQYQAIRARLGAGLLGTVAFTDLENVIRGLFEPQLDDLTPEDLCVLLESVTESQAFLCDSEDQQEMERLRKEHMEALREIENLQEQLVESQRVHRQMEAELVRVRQQEVKLGTEESLALRAQIQRAEVAQKQARGMELDYEEVVHLLEAEIAELKTQRASTNQEETDGLRKNFAVLECQLRKSQAARKSFEASTRKLLTFVENIQEFLLQNQGPTLSYSSTDAQAGGSSPVLPPCHQKPPWTSVSLAQEAIELSRTIKPILEVGCLPYGWDEAYTADGDKYYVNHMSQTTSWSLQMTSTPGAGPPPPVQTSGPKGRQDRETVDQRSRPSVETEM
ncbi:syntaxin-binding protein 4 isoform X3 [Antennarius striatus]|uniref:syntaxin-binding protein 4 isoform X3 n=1 Tax=Antennarius striatus TaxID=241820 RepID=UPI0035ADA1CF